MRTGVRRGTSKADLLLIEILIVVFFFMISLTVLVQIFAGARSGVLLAETETQALCEAQNAAEELRAAEDASACLLTQGFTYSHGVYAKNCGSFSLSVTLEEEELSAGSMLRAVITAYAAPVRSAGGRAEEKELFAIPCAVYRGSISG